MDIGWTALTNTYYRKVIRTDNDKVLLDADMIRLLIAIEEDKSLHQICEEVDMDTATFKDAISKLLQQGLIEPVKKDLVVLDSNFLDTLRINLSRAIGPIAEILIEDLVAEMQLNRSAIPLDQAAELVAQLSLKIQNADIQKQFKRSMIAILNKARR
jgi:hypothetical protein